MSPTEYKASLLSLSIDTKVLSFGDYTLKSGRKSPYFMTTTLLHTAPLLHAVAASFADVISQPPFTTTDAQTQKPTPQFDILFGPAYKGVPLATSVMTEIGRRDTSGVYANVSYSFNRKEAKAHGEGGNIVGAPLRGKRVVIIDDVITAGTALREAVGIIENEGGVVAGVLILMDRQERVSDEDGKSAVQAAQEALGADKPVVPLLRFTDIIEELGSKIGEENLKNMLEYKQRYGAL